MEIENVSILVPVYNESKYIVNFAKDLLKELEKLPIVKKVIFIDDGSTDTTPDLIKNLQKNNPKIGYIRHEVNLGKGEAMKTGLNEAQKQKSGAIIFMDGDRQHHPKHLSSFLTKLKEQPIVFGYRHLSKEAPWIRRTGNKIAGLIIHNLFKIKRKDLLCGFMALRNDVYKQVTWKSAGYGVEVEISAVVGRKSIPFQEVFISTIYLDKNKGVTLWHAFKILLNLPWWYFQVR